MKRNTRSYGINKLRAAIYARKSSEDKSETSLPTQIADCKKIIKKYEFITLVNTYQEEDVSGMFIDGRTQYQDMIKEVAKGNIDVVIVMRLDRFGRNMQDQLTAINLMRTLNCYYIAGDEIGDPNTAEGELMRGIQLAINQHIPRQVAKNTMHALVNNVQNGNSAGGRPPYGFKVIQKRYYIDDEKAPAVKLIFKKVSEGYSYQEIVEDLSALGYKANNGETFNYSTISCMLRNPKYYGTYVYNKTGGKRRKKRVLLEDFGEVINEKAIPQIITKELFDKVQQILKDKKLNTSARKKGDNSYILTGLIYCKNCGKTISGFSQSAGGKKQKYRTYICLNHTKKNGKTCFTKPINAEYIEKCIKKTITDAINDYLTNKNLSNSLFCQLKKNLTNEKGILSRHIADLDKKISSLANRAATTTSECTVKVYEDEIAKHSQDKKTLEDNLKELNLKIQAVQNIKNCSSVTSLLEVSDIFTTDEESRAICRLFIKKIEIDDQNDDIDITFNF